MAKKAHQKANTTQTTVEKGDAFEEEVANVFRCMPNATVERHVKKAGKDVDIFVTIKETFRPNLRIVVDTKDYHAPVDRQQCSTELASYYPIIQKGEADQFILVTRKGIVANAKDIFDKNSTFHLTISDLQNKVVDPTQLVDDMIRLFSDDKLNEYYIPAKCYKKDIAFAQKNYDRCYNNFVTYCFSYRISDVATAKETWLKKFGNRAKLLAESYDDTELKMCLSHRNRAQKLDNLEDIVLEWLNNDLYDVSIALLGTYGTGKSSFSKRIAFVAASLFKEGRSQRIPLLIELRNFGSHQDIEGLITHTLVNKHGYTNGSYGLFQKMNLLGKYLLILDGFDEMKQGMTKDALAYNFSELNKLCVENSRVILCGRPTMFESEEEKSAILSGGSAVEVANKGKYVPLEIAPLTNDDILALIKNFNKAKSPADGQARVAAKIEDIRKEIEHNIELNDLLSRPVHIPMFVTILPEYEDSIASLNRSFLYETFIKKIIHREVMRLPAAYKNRYSTEQRFSFIGSLALEMAKRGEARSIRRSEIPVKIIEPFVNSGETVEIASRDLVAACFLEQKLPDLLIFGHKSFFEFLVAYHLKNSNNKTEDIIYPSSEISSFLFDLCTPADLDSFVNAGHHYCEFIVAAIISMLNSFYIDLYERSNVFMEIRITSSFVPYLRHFCSYQFLTKLASNQLSLAARDSSILVFF